MVHRFAWEFFFGEIPVGMFACHHCDVPLCCNPWHMFLGTPGDNARDRAAKGRSHRPFGTDHPMSKLTEKDVGEIQAKYLTGAYKQHELAQEYGITQGHISRICRGRWGRPQ